jgi:hypothetical protein
MDTIFFPVSFLFLSHEHCCGFFCDLMDELSLRSWGNFGRPATPGMVHHCGSPLWTKALTVVRWSPKALEMAL